MICQCGKELPEGAMFCGGCGRSIEVVSAAAMEPEVAPVVEPVIEAPVVEASVVEAPAAEPVVEAPAYDAPVAAAPIEKAPSKVDWKWLATTFVVVVVAGFCFYKSIEGLGTCCYYIKQAFKAIINSSVGNFFGDLFEIVRYLLWAAACFYTALAATLFGFRKSEENRDSLYVAAIAGGVLMAVLNLVFIILDIISCGCQGILTYMLTYIFVNDTGCFITYLLLAAASSAITYLLCKKGGDVLLEGKKGQLGQVIKGMIPALKAELRVVMGK